MPPSKTGEMSALQRAIAEKSRRAEEDETAAQRLSLKRQIEEKARQEEEDDKTWQRARWEAARKALADGTFYKREPRFPVIITRAGPISSAEELQRLAELDSVPQVIQTALVVEEGIETEKPVTICHVGYDGKDKVEEKANVEPGMSGKFTVMIRGERRNAMVVRSLKEGVTL